MMKLIMMGLCSGLLWFAGTVATTTTHSPAAVEAPGRIQDPHRVPPRSFPVDNQAELSEASPLLELLERSRAGSREAFDNSTLNGNYAFSSTGATSSFIYSVITYWRTIGETRMGIWQFDGAGAFTQTRITHGSVLQQYDGVSTELKGTYTLDSAGAVKFMFANGFILSGIVTENGSGFVFEGRNRIPDTGTTTHTAESGSARKLN
ncbi:MAG: hypothetical protein HY650_12180 [Acidobacteria bacterium]|nr:hypothetical protein [Acidobacteriota bacterium]